MAEFTDAELIRRVQSGDEQAFTELYGRYKGMIIHIAKQRFGYLQYDDVVQEVMLRVWIHRDRYDSGRGNFGAWLARIATNHLLNAVKRERRLVIGLDDLPEIPDFHLPSDPENERESSHIRSCLIQQALSKLRIEHQNILTLRYLAGYDAPEIAQLLGVDVGTVRTRIHRAKAHLGKVICKEFSLQEIRHCL